MTRAQLAAMRSYQPSARLEPRARPGVPPISVTHPRAFAVGFWLFVVGTVTLVVLPALVLANCTPAQAGSAAHGLDVGSQVGEYGAAVVKCRIDTMADGGTFRDFQRCACDVDRRYQLDAASAGAECAR